MMRALDKVRFSDALFKALPMAAFILSGCLRQLLGARSLRDYPQALFHHDASLSMPPIARSTWSDALASVTRGRVLRETLHHLVAPAQAILPDRHAHVSGIGKRAVSTSCQTDGEIVK